MVPTSTIELRAMDVPIPRLHPPAHLPVEVLVVLDDSVMRRSDALREMMGFARAIVADGELSEAEAKGFHAWIQTHPDILGLQMVDEIVEILTNVFADGKLSERERAHLVDALERFGG